jgi:hypothetical protein
LAFVPSSGSADIPVANNHPPQNRDSVLDCGREPKRATAFCSFHAFIPAKSCGSLQVHSSTPRRYRDIHLSAPGTSRESSAQATLGVTTTNRRIRQFAPLFESHLHSSTSQCQRRHNGRALHRDHRSQFQLRQEEAVPRAFKRTQRSTGVPKRPPVSPKYPMHCSSSGTLALRPSVRNSACRFLNVAISR